MKLRTGGTRAEVAAAPAAGLAIVLLLLAGLSGSLSAQTGLCIRLPGRPSRVAPIAAGDAAPILLVLPDDSLVLDGEPVTRDRLLPRLEAKLGPGASRPLILHVSDDAPYGSMVATVDLLAGGARPSSFRVRRLLVPTHAEIRVWARAVGRDPLGPTAGGDAPERP